jgi:hypothetical protein
MCTCKGRVSPLFERGDTRFYFEERLGSLVVQIPIIRVI